MPEPILETLMLASGPDLRHTRYTYTAVLPASTFGICTCVFNRAQTKSPERFVFKVQKFKHSETLAGYSSVILHAQALGSIPSTARKEAKLEFVAHTVLHWILLTKEMWHWHSQLDPPAI